MQTGINLENLYSDNVKNMQDYIMFRIKQETVRLAPELNAKGRTPIYLSIGAPVQAPPDFVINAIKAAIDEESIHLYSVPRGETFYLEAVAKRMADRFNVKLDPKTEITSLVGSKEGLANIFRVLINPSTNENQKDIILIPDPGYASYQEQIKVIGGTSYPIPLTPENNYMPDLELVMDSLKNDGLDSSKVKAIVLNYPSNPLGATASRDYLQSIVDFAHKYGIIIVSDLAYADIYFEGQEPPASILEMKGAMDLAIEFHSFSKPYSMTGWRIGWACGNQSIISALLKIKSTVDTGIFKAVQQAASLILNSEEGEDYIKCWNKLYANKQEIMVNGLRELGWNVDDLNIPKATFYLWIPVPARFASASDFTQNLLEVSGIVAVPGTAFGRYGEGFIRLSLVASDENLYKTIERMKKDGFTFE